MLKHWNIEREYGELLEALNALEEIEKERFLDKWEEEEKLDIQRDLAYYGELLEEADEDTRRQICESQGLSRYC